MMPCTPSPPLSLGILGWTIWLSSSPTLQDLNTGVLEALTCGLEQLEAGVEEPRALGVQPGEGAAVATSAARTLECCHHQGKAPGCHMHCYSSERA